MQVEKISGIVRYIENINEQLSIVNLVTLEKNCPEKRVLVYMELYKDYTERWVDITSYKYGIVWKRFYQVVEGLNYKEMNSEMLYSKVKEIGKNILI